MEQAKPRALKSLDEIFRNMIERTQEQPLVPEPETPQEPECLCQGNLYSIKTKPGGRVYEVCPRCNPRRTCKLCGGTGHERRMNPQTLSDELLPFGCECVVTEERVALLSQAGIPEKYMGAEFSFGNVLHGYQKISPQMAEKFSQNEKDIMSFCEEADKCIRKGVEAGDRFFLTLTGPVGTGKTYLGICALKHLIWEFGHTGRFIDFQFLLSQIRDCYSRKSSEEELLRPLRQVDVLMIDEFGKGRTENEWELEKLDDLVNNRYNNGKATIITTNYLPRELRDFLLQIEQQVRKGQIPADDKLASCYRQIIEGSKGHPSETYLSLSLADRIGERMYDRILEVSKFVDFVGIPSFRRKAAEDFLERFRRALLEDEPS